MISHDSKIIIVGAGVFGLSTALWLARAGYKNISVFDRCAFDVNYYNPLDGCDGASADINKIFRTGYGTEQEYDRQRFYLGPHKLTGNIQVPGTRNCGSRDMARVESRDQRESSI